MQIGFLGLNLFLEVLNSCSWNCPGCFVNKSNRAEEFLAADVERLSSLCDEYQAKGHPLQRLFVGPTDFLTATNFTELSQSKEFKHLANRFDILTMYSTLLGDIGNFRERFSKIKSVHPNIKVIVPVMAKNVLEQSSYVERLKERLQLLKDEFGIDDIQFAFNLLPKDNQSFLKISELFLAEFGIKPEYNLSFSRSLDLTSDREEIYSKLQFVYNQLDFSIGRDGGAEETVEDWFVRILVYREGQLFHMPLLLDPYINFDSRFVHTEDWNYEGLQKHESQLVLESYQSLDQLPECGTCEFLGLCSHLGINRLMMRMGEKRCIAPKGHFEDANEVSDYRVWPWSHTSKKNLEGAESTHIIGE